MKTIARILPILTIVVAALTGCSSQQSETSSTTEAGADGVPKSSTTDSQGLTPPPGQSEAWVLLQKGEGVGEQTIYLNSVGCRVENEPMDIKFVVAGTAAAPDVAIWSDKKKLIYRNTLAGLEAERRKQVETGEKIAKKFGATKEQTPFAPGKQEKIAGLPATEYVQVVKTKNPMDGSTTKTTTAIWLTSEIRPPSGVVQMMKTKMDGLPSDMMPLRMIVDVDGKKVVVSDTKKVDKIPMPATAFNTPSGYRRVPCEIDVAMGEGTGRALSEMQRNIVEGPVLPKGAMSDPRLLNKMRAGAVPPRPAH